VIVVHNFSEQVTDSLIETIARQLREACACGGTVKNRTVEIQSDQPATIRTTLEGLGFQVVGITDCWSSS
jgi:translation initiation factor 1 (eIF-1/SUI1)